MVIYPGGPSVGAAVGVVSSAEAVIPTLASGGNPKWLHVAISSLDDAISFFLGITGMGAATFLNGVGVQSASSGIIIYVQSFTHFRAIGVNADTQVTITPLDHI